MPRPDSCSVHLRKNKEYPARDGGQPQGSCTASAFRPLIVSTDLCVPLMCCILRWRGVPSPKEEEQAARIHGLVDREKLPAPYMSDVCSARDNRHETRLGDMQVGRARSSHYATVYMCCADLRGNLCTSHASDFHLERVLGHANPEARVAFDIPPLPRPEMYPSSVDRLGFLTLRAPIS